MVSAENIEAMCHQGHFYFMSLQESQHKQSKKRRVAPFPQSDLMCARYDEERPVYSRTAPRIHLLSHRKSKKC